MSWLGGLVDNVKDFFGDLADNAEALFSGEKKVFGKSVNKKEKKGNAKKKSKGHNGSCDICFVVWFYTVYLFDYLCVGK